MRGYIEDLTAGSFDWPGSLEEVERKVKQVCKITDSPIIYEIEEVQQNDEIIKIVVWHVE